MRTRRAAAALFVVGAAIFGACSSDDGATGSDTFSEETAPLAEDPAPLPDPQPTSSGQLDTATACAEFYDLVSDLTLSDEESAAAFAVLASRTSDPALADAIRRVADGFARSAPEISAAEVNALCG